MQHLTGSVVFDWILEYQYYVIVAVILFWELLLIIGFTAQRQLNGVPQILKRSDSLTVFASNSLRGSCESLEKMDLYPAGPPPYLEKEMEISDDEESDEDMEKGQGLSCDFGNILDDQPPSYESLYGQEGEQYLSSDNDKSVDNIYRIPI